jgi:hypothetical protein
MSGFTPSGTPVRRTRRHGQGKPLPSTSRRPALFAIGLRALVMPGSRVQTVGADSDHVYGGNVLGLVIAAICFLIILAALGWGIYEVYQIGHPAPAKH